MESSKISGTVKKVGTRVTHTEQILRIEDAMEISLDLSADQQREFQKNPGDLIKRLLTQEGHAFRDVSIAADHGISHLRSGWFHIVYDKGTPANVCVWIYVRGY